MNKPKEQEWEKQLKCEKCSLLITHDDKQCGDKGFTTYHSSKGYERCNFTTKKEWEAKIAEAVKAERERCRKEMIEELEAIENENLDIEVHCSCLGYAIFKMKCNCDDECGECRIKALDKQ